MEKIIWTRKDNFETMYSKFKALVGEKIIIDGKEFTIKSLSDIVEAYWENHLANFVAFAKGDPGYSGRGGGFNFNNPALTPIWQYTITLEHKYGDYTNVKPYNIQFPRSGDLSKDIKCTMYAENCYPFIVFEESKF